MAGNEVLFAVYPDDTSAQAAVQDLIDAGVNRSSINLISNDVEGRYKQYFDDDGHYVGGDDNDVSGGEGAGFGAVIGTLAGLGMALIPGIGPVMAAGPAAAALMAGIGAATGAITGGITASLIDMGVDENEAHTYQEIIRRGGTLVMVEGADSDSSRIHSILERHNPIDIDERHQAYRSEGWQGFSADSEPYDNEHIQQHRDQVRTVHSGEQAKVDVVEENINIGKREVDAGAARIRKVVTERPVSETVTLRQENINVERHPVDRRATEADFQEGVIEVTARAEEAVVNKEARVVEEVVVSKDVSERQETIQDTVRRTDVQIDENVSAGGTFGAYETYEADFRSDYDTNFASSGYTYEQLSPAYRYGYTLGTTPRYSGYTWDQVEADARSDWETRSPGTWDRVKDAIRRSWERVTGQTSRY